MTEKRTVSARNGLHSGSKSVPRRKFQKKFKEQPVDEVSTEGVLIADIKRLLAQRRIDLAEITHDMQAVMSRPRDIPYPYHREVELEISAMSANGEGIAIFNDKLEVPSEELCKQTSEAASKLESPDGSVSAEQPGEAVDEPSRSIAVVPYTTTGDKIIAKLYRTNKYYYESELVKVLEPSPKRNDSLVQCKYFAKCSGCQYQMISYEDQLKLKREVIVNAYNHFIEPSLKSRIPEILATAASPKQYKYRTKLTPHFDVPKAGLSAPPPIGFGQKGRKALIDIEECVIGTPVLQEGLEMERKRIHETFGQFKRGATLLLRETEDDTNPSVKKCSTSTKDIITEVVGDYKFKFPAGSFFQNNNSILPDVTSYVRSNILLDGQKPPTYLVDTYCGSGLFAVTCSSAVESVIGVEISKDSVEYARQNAELNGLKNASFIVGQAEKIFDDVKADPAVTSIIIDPPRKGCDELFLNQLLAFKPAKVVYISCNVHSQARDLQYLLSHDENYTVESIRGFDFFPQTYHVESVAVLSLKK